MMLKFDWPNAPVAPTPSVGVGDDRRLGYTVAANLLHHNCSSCLGVTAYGALNAFPLRVGRTTGVKAHADSSSRPLAYMCTTAAYGM